MKNIFDLTGKTAFVTGSGRGIGRSAALELGRNGASVIFHATAMNETLKSALADAEKEGISCRAVTGDLGKAEDLQRIIREAGNPDIVILNASVQKYMTLPEFEEEEFMRTFRINLLSCIEMVRAFLPGMQQKKWGRVIAVGSVNQLRPAARLFAYGSGKAALSNFMQGCAKEYSGDGITFNTVVPGVIATDRNKAALADPERVKMLLNGIPARFFGTPEDCAGVFLLLSSDAGRYITGADIPVSGGMHL